MSLFDVILVLIIAGFALFGLWFGLVRTLGSLIGTVVGVYIAGRYYEPLANWIIHLTGWSENHVKVIIFIAAFLIITRLVGFVFWIISKFLSIFTQLPFIGGLDRMLGFIFGAVEGMLVLGVSFYFIARFPVNLPFMEGLAHSEVAPSLVRLASVVIPLFPQAIRILHSTVDNLI